MKTLFTSKPFYAKLFLFLSFSLLLSFDGYSQGVSINETGDEPNPSSILDVSSSDKGLLIPRMSLAERDAISNPAKGLLVFQVDEKPGFYFYDGLKWVFLADAPCTPEMPDTIFGNPYPECNETAVTYALDSVEAASAYYWTISGNGTITSGQGTPQIEVNFGSSGGEIRVQALSGCGNSDFKTLSYSIGIPADPDTIYGNLYPDCNESGVVYSIDSIPGATNYTWSVPEDATITSGQGSAEIIVTTGTSSGQVSVSAENTCGSSSQIYKEITIGVPAAPDTIYGPSEVCWEYVEAYTIDSVPGAINYQWSVSGDAIIIDGQGTTSISVEFSDEDAVISAQIENNCGLSNYFNLSIDVHLNEGCLWGGGIVVINDGYIACITTQEDFGPAPWWDSACETIYEGPIFANGYVPPIGVQNTQIILSQYNLNCTFGGTNAAGICDDLSYNGYNDWFLPSIYLFETIVNLFPEIEGYYWSSTEEIVIEESGDTTSSPLSFYCPGVILSDIPAYGHLKIRPTRYVCFNPPLQPAGFAFGPVSPGCNSSDVEYIVNEVAGATGYTWTVPPDAVITWGQGTKRIKVNFGMQPGNLSVCATNDCGSSNQLILPITIGAPETPGTIYGDTIPGCSASGSQYWIDEVFDASSYYWSVPPEANIISGQGTNLVIIDFGTQSGDITVYAENDCGVSGTSSQPIIISSPSTPDTIYGPDEICILASNISYWVEKAPGTVIYNWTIPQGTSIVGGYGTDSITVTFGSQSGLIGVEIQSSCGSSDFYSKEVDITVVGCELQGGVAFYENDEYVLISSDMEIGSEEWGCYGLEISYGNGADDASIGSGFYNTQAILHECSELNAARLCDNYIFNGYDDWYLPSIGELEILCVNLISQYYFGYINSYMIWSSTESPPSGIWAKPMLVSTPNCGTTGVMLKNENANVWAIRAFSKIPPSQPPEIFGDTIFNCQESSIHFSTDPVFLAEYYSWLVPPDATITSGQGTDEITVDFGSQEGFVSVQAVNDSGSSAPASISIFLVGPTKPDTIYGPTNPYCNQINVSYWIDPVPYATDYIWTVPSETTIVSGQGTSSIIVNFGTQSGDIRVSAANDCGISSESIISVIVGGLGAVGNISGNATQFCNETGITYSISTVSGATSYNWTIPTGATIVSGQGTTAITVDFGTDDGNVSVRAQNDCDTTVYTNLAITLAGPPAAPGAITGDTDPLCQETTVSFSISPVATASSYNWTVPIGATITSGQGTTSITVDFGSASGDVSVSAVNVCGASSFTSLAVTVGALSPPGAITGNTTPFCNETGVPYSIDPVGDAISYNWTVPTGATIASGQGTTSITVDFTTNDGNVSVRSQNDCDTSVYTNLAISLLGAPSVPGAITGNTMPGCEATGVSYSISPVTDATSYNWLVPSGATITSGQGTTSVTVDFGISDGDISVRAENYCGNSSYQTMAVQVGHLGSIGSITGDSNPAYNETGVSYSIAPVSGATNYYWEVPTGASITSGQGTSNIVVSFDTISGNVRVRAENNCDTTTYAELAVSLTLQLGCSYAGGIVFYIDGTGEHGMVCPTFDQSPGIIWGCDFNITSGNGANGTAVGDGAPNTEAIITDCTEPNVAARICYNLNLNGYSDWFLPSIGELELMYQNLHQGGIGNFQNTYYWSSTELSPPHAEYYDFFTGFMDDEDKQLTMSVRAARSF